MGILNRFFGYRWSLYVVRNGNQLCYVVHENSVVRILGYVMGRFHEYGNPVSPWSLHLNFNRTHKSFPLHEEHFTPDGQDLSETLVQVLRAIDPKFEQIRGAEPVVMEAASKKHIPIQSSLSSLSMQERIRSYSDPNHKEEITLFTILDEVFGETNEHPEDDV